MCVCASIQFHEGLGDQFEGGQDLDDSLRVRGYRFGHNGASVLAQALIINTTLKSINLRGHVCALHFLLLFALSRAALYSPLP